MSSTFFPEDLAIPLKDTSSLPPELVDEIETIMGFMELYLHEDVSLTVMGGDAAFCAKVARLCDRLADLAPLDQPQIAHAFMDGIRKADEVTMGEAWLYCLYVLCVDSREHARPNQPIARLRCICQYMTTGQQAFISHEAVLDQPVVY